MTNSINRPIHSDFAKKQAMNKWNLVQLLNINERVDYSFAILNTPIQNPKLLLPLWNRGKCRSWWRKSVWTSVSTFVHFLASFRMVVDGGGNQLYSLMEQYKTADKENFWIPNVISGDFDSVKPDVLEFYRQKDTLVVHTPDQNKTDFFKALEVLISTTKVRLFN